MSCEPETAVLLRESGHKVTPQRMLILSALRHGEHRTTAGAILEEVRRTYPFVDASTVYRTLAVARELGLVAEVNVPGGEIEFEWVGMRHFHLVCRTCGGDRIIQGSQLDELSAALSQQYDFDADLAHLAIGGRCRRCAAEDESKESTGAHT